MSPVAGDVVPWETTEDAVLFDSPPGPGFDDAHPVAAVDPLIAAWAQQTGKPALHPLV